MNYTNTVQACLFLYVEPFSSRIETTQRSCNRSMLKHTRRISLLQQQHRPFMHRRSGMVFNWWCPKVIWALDICWVEVSTGHYLILKLNTNSTSQRCHTFTASTFIAKPRSCIIVFLIVPDPLLYRSYRNGAFLCRWAASRTRARCSHSYTRTWSDIPTVHRACVRTLPKSDQILSIDRLLTAACTAYNHTLKLVGVLIDIII